MLSILTAKTEGLYFACSPECGVVTYGGCRDEALNNLQDEIRLNQSAAPVEIGLRNPPGVVNLDSPMLRPDDEFEPEYPCPNCGRTFSSFARLDDHLAEHEGPRRCRLCGETIHGAYHRC